MYIYVCQYSRRALLLKGPATRTEKMALNIREQHETCQELFVGVRYNAPMCCWGVDRMTAEKVLS